MKIFQKIQFDRFSDAAQNIADASAKLLSRYNQNQIDTEFILLAILEQPDGKVPIFFKQFQIETAGLLEQLDAILRSVHKVETDDPKQIFSTRRVKQIVERAYMQANALKSQTIEPEHIFLAILAEKGTPSAEILTSAGVTREKMLAFLASQASNQSAQAEKSHSFWNKLKRAIWLNAEKD